MQTFYRTGNEVESHATSYLEQALLLGQNTFLQVPEVEMRFPTGHYDAAVSRVKVCTQHRLVGALGPAGKKSNKTETQQLSCQSMCVCEQVTVCLNLLIELTLTSASLSSLCQSHTERT